ncbi:beta strand repeat-containing protein [Pontiella sp.]|uniref:beta strand repeat-containing protein n=1 Tax=Pontiella sp. TaxID=2837462 RepID=UPI003565C9D7
MKKTLNLLAFVALPISLMAQTTVTWDGLGDGTTYEDGGNWGGTAPANDLTSNIAQLTGGTVDLSTTRQVSGLDFNVGSTLSGTGSLEIGSGGIEVNGNSYLTMAGIVLNQADTTVTLAGGRLSFGSGSTVSGSGALTVTGNNTLYMDGGANTYAGGTTITGGARISVKNGGALGAGTLTLDNGTFARNGADYSFGNAVTVNSGGGTIDINGNLTGAITGTGALTIIGQGSEKTITSDASGHSGGVTLDNTFYRTGNANAYGAGTITLKNGATIKNNNNNLTFGQSMVLDEGGGRFMAGWGRSITLNGAISGSGDLTILSDSGTITLGNTDKTYTGETIIEGKVSGRNGSFGDNATGGGFTFNGGTMVANHHLSLGERAVSLTGDNHMQVYNTRSLTIDGVVDGTGKLTVDNDGGSVRLTNSENSYSGGTEIIGFVNANSGGLGTGDITLNDGNGSRGQLQNFNVASTFDNNLIVAANGGRLKAGWNSDLTINGEVSGSGALTIEGDSGTVILGNAANTYSGAINLAAATSRLSLASLGSGATISGDAGATLTLLGDIDLDTVNSFAGTTTVGSGGSIAGSGSLAGDLVIDAGGKITFSTTETLTVAGTITLDNTFGIDDLIGLDGTTVAEDTYTLIANGSDFSNIENWGIENAADIGGGKSAYFQEGSLQVVVIPEPATLGMIVLFGGGILFIRRRFMI